MYGQRRVQKPSLEERIGKFKTKASSIAEGVGFAGLSLGVYTNYMLPKIWFGTYLAASDNAWKVVSHIPGYEFGWEYSIANLVATGVGYSIGAAVPLVAYKLGKENHVPSKAAKVGANIAKIAARGAAAAIKFSDDAAYCAANYIKEAYDRSKGKYNNRRPAHIGDNGRLLLRAGSVSFLALCLFGYAGLQSGFIHSRTPPPNKPIAIEKPLAAAPTPTPVSIPIVQQSAQPNRFNMSQDAINFLTRVIFGESGRYDPENNRSPGYTIAEYESAFVQGVVDIATVIENRSKDSTWFRGQDSLTKVAVAPGQFDVVFWKGNEGLYFKTKTTKLPQGYMSLPENALLGYLNTGEITEEEIKTVWTSGKPEDVALYKKKLELVKKGIGYFMRKDIDSLEKSRTINPRLPPETTFYLNQKVALSADWLRQCMGNVQLEPVHEDGNAIVYPWRHTFYRIAGPCRR